MREKANLRRYSSPGEQGKVLVLILLFVFFPAGWGVERWEQRATSFQMTAYVSCREASKVKEHGVMVDDFDRRVFYPVLLRH